MKVSVVMGSMSDYPKVEQAVNVLKSFNVGVDVQCLSAHRCLDELMSYLDKINNDGTEVIIACAGMAAALPSGNLIVPVIKNADQLNLVGMAKVVNDLADRARKGKLKPDDTQGGTFTVTNIGSFGSVFGTPIINQPQVGILALGAIRKVPAVIETPEGDFIGIRQKMFLTHSYDHRVVDGALGGQFVQRVAYYLENFDAKREI